MDNKGTLNKTEIYKLIDSKTGNEYPVKVTIKYYKLGPKISVTLEIPDFSLSNNTYREFKFEGDPSFTAGETILKDEAIINLNNHFNNSYFLPTPTLILDSQDPPPIPYRRTEDNTNPSSTTVPTTSSTSQTTETVDPDADLIKPDNIETEDFVPEDVIKLPEKPEEINQVTQSETEKKEEEQVYTDVVQPDKKVIEDNTPTNLKPPAKEKITKVIKKKEKEIKNVLVKTVIALLLSVGAKYIGSKLVLPNTCAAKPITDRAIKIRNEIVRKLNNISRFLNTVVSILTGLTLATAIFETLIKTLKTSRQAASIVAAAIPPPAGVPGQIVAALNTLKDTEEIASKNSYRVSSALASITLYIAALNAALILIISLLNQLDAYISQCDPDAELEPLSPILLEIQQINSRNQEDQNKDITVYKNFKLEIEEVPFSPTVVRRRAIAKNKNGIVVLQTPLSFTTLGEILITELKLLIDTNNLKAD